MRFFPRTFFSRRLRYPNRDNELKRLSPENLKEMLRRNLDKMSVISENMLLSRSKSKSRSRSKTPPKPKKPRPYNRSRTNKMKEDGTYQNFVKKLKTPRPIPRTRRQPNQTL